MVEDEEDEGDCVIIEEKKMGQQEADLLGIERGDESPEKKPTRSES